MFTGDRSGDWLWSALHRAGMARRECSTATGDGQALLTARMGATVRCAPPANKPTAEERSTCSAYLVREIELMKNLKVFLALGGIAWNATLSAVKAAGWRVPPAQTRGRPRGRGGGGGRHDGRDVTLLGCYHPSQQNTFTGRLTRSMLDDVLAEARRLAAG
jgi:uracil-DNA glycosylase superfamily protein